MEIKNGQAYLTIQEQLESGYKSPIDIASFEFHEERVKADAKRDEIRMNSMDEEILHPAQRAEQQYEYSRAAARSLICHEIAKFVGLNVAVEQTEIPDDISGLYGDNA